MHFYNSYFANHKLCESPSSLHSETYCGVPRRDVLDAVHEVLVPTPASANVDAAIANFVIGVAVFGPVGVGGNVVRLKYVIMIK